MSGHATRPVPVACQLEKGLASLAEAMPTDLASKSDLLAYRRASAARRTTAEVIAARFDLMATERDAGGHPATVFSPGGATVAARALFLHGGGLIAGNRFDGVDVVARHARELALEVWTLEYPLAPEHPFTEMVQAAADAVQLCGADDVPVVLVGQSAGGGIAAAAALDARDRGIPLLGQMLICPMLSRTQSTSTRQYPHDPSWSPRSNETAWAAALAGTGAVPPAEREDLDGLGASYLDTGSAEIFRDAIIAYASALMARGNRTELHVWSGGFHGFDGVAEEPTVSTEAHRARREWLRRLLRQEL